MPPARFDRGTRRIVLCGLATASGVVLLFSYRTSTSSDLPGEASVATDVGTAVPALTPSPLPAPSSGAPSPAAAAPSPPASSSAASSPEPSPGPTRATVVAPSSRRASGRTGWSGAVTGPAIPVRWGQVQVRASLAEGRIVDVDVVRVPNANSGDEQINARAVPILVRETLAAQTARIDMVSGATLTSAGYARSLQAALDRVGAS